MENFNDSVSYAVGMDIAKFYQKQGVKLNPELIYSGIREMQAGNERLTIDEALNVVGKFQQQQFQLSLANTKIAGEKFLESNARKEGVSVLPTGLQYRVLKEGTGATPKAESVVRVHYKGRFTNGEVFASTDKSAPPAEVQVENLLPGWTEALLMMKEGDQWEICLPADLAYGAEGFINQEENQMSIPPYSVLIYEIELVEVL